MPPVTPRMTFFPFSMLSPPTLPPSALNIRIMALLMADGRRGAVSRIGCSDKGKDHQLLPDTCDQGFMGTPRQGGPPYPIGKEGIPGDYFSLVRKVETAS